MSEKDVKSVLVIERLFEAPRNLVFKAFTEAEHLKHWWGPKGFGMEIQKFDLQPNGVFHYKQTSPEGHEMWGKFDYQEVSEPEKLVYTNSFSDEEGRTIRAPFSSTWPMKILNTVVFTEEEGRTKLVMEGTPVNPSSEEQKTFEDALGMVKQGFGGTLDQLSDYLKKIN